MIKINPEFQNCIPPLTKEEFNLLEKSIKEEGVREPLIIWNDFIVDGHNRYKIAKELKIDFKIKEKKFENKNEVFLWIINNQLARRNISNYDRIKLALKYEEIIKLKAQKNLRIATGGKKGLTLPKSAKSIDTREEVSKIAKVSHDTVEKVKFIEEFSTPEQKKRLQEQKESINYIYNQTRVIKNKEKGILEMDLPKNKFFIIYADPPWKHNFGKSSSRFIGRHYSLMDLEDIKKMKVPSQENSVLFLWTPAPKLKEALEVMEFWGYEYKTCAIWDKEVIGMGYWFRSQHELLLIGTKGKVKTPDESLRISSIVRIKRTEHSKKPEYFYEMIEKMFPNQSYLELFARKKRKNWVSWGNEI